MKKINNQNNINIYINLYVHYPETFNGTIINDKLKKYFDCLFFSFIFLQIVNFHHKAQIYYTPKQVICPR